MKTALKILGALSLIAWGLSFGHAAQVCQRTDFFCYESGPSQNLTTPARLDVGGNLTLVGNAIVTGEGIYNVQLITGVSSTTTISPTSTYVQVASTGGAVNIGGFVNAAGTSYVAISTTGASAGQLLILYSTGTTTSVQISTGAAGGINTGVVGSANNLSTAFPKMLEFMYDAVDSVWREVHD